MYIENKLEKNILFRVIKVSYYSLLVLAFLFVLILGLSFRKITYLDTTKSYIECYNGKQHSFSSINILTADGLENIQVKKSIFERCLGYFMGQAKKEGYIDKEITDFLKNKGVDMAKPYTFKLVYSSYGSLSKVLLVWFLGSVLAFSTISIATEVLLYIFFGRRMTWMWLQLLINFGKHLINGSPR